MKYCFSLFLLFASNIAFSQANDSLLRKYDRQFITRYGNNFMKGKEKLTFRQLQSEFSTSAIGMELYRKAKNQRTVSKVFRFVSLGALFGIIAGTSNNNRNVSYAFLGAQFVSIAVSSSFYRRSVLETDRALQIRNRELLFPGK